MMPRVSRLAPAGAFALAATLGLPAATHAQAVVDPANVYVSSFEGWGTSLAWGPNVVGGWSDPNRTAIADLLFSPTSGLGLNIVRYHIGAGLNPDWQAIGCGEQRRADYLTEVVNHFRDFWGITFDYGYKNFTKFIRPGYRIIASGDAQTLASYDAGSKQLVLVTYNDGNSNRSVTYDLSAFSPISRATPYRTSSTQNLAQLSNVSVTNNQLAVTLLKKSVTTCVITNVTAP